MDTLESAERQASSSTTTPATMRVKSSPTKDTALTNKAYCSPNDFHFSSSPAAGPGEGFVYVNNQIVLTVSTEASISNGCLALNAIQRRNLKVSQNDDVKVARFVPEKESDLVQLTMNLNFVKFRGKAEELDAGGLRETLNAQHQGQVMTKGQMVFFEYRGTNYIFTVREISVKEALLGAEPTRVSTFGILEKGDSSEL